MNLNDFMADKIVQAERIAESKSLPLNRRVVHQGNEARPRLPNHLRSEGGFPTTSAGPSSDKSLAYPPSGLHINTIRYRVWFEREVDSHRKEIVTEDFEFTDGSSLEGSHQFWWHLPSLLASNFIGRGGTHVINQVQVLEVLSHWET